MVSCASLVAEKTGITFLLHISHYIVSDKVCLVQKTNLRTNAGGSACDFRPPISLARAALRACGIFKSKRLEN